MTIEKNVQGETTVLKLFGRLDTSTAHSLEDTVNESIASVKELIMDFEGLIYLSSAGLRVLLKAEKAMRSQGCMKLIHVNDAIMEILAITGFIGVLTIE